jgi:hypothetical protein
MVKPHFHVFFPSANARYSVGWERLSCSMRDIVEVAIVSLLLEKGS